MVLLKKGPNLLYPKNMSDLGSNTVQDMEIANSVIVALIANYKEYKFPLDSIFLETLREIVKERKE
jgi:hypothetical protein